MFGVGVGMVVVCGIERKILLKRFSCNVSQSELRLSPLVALEWQRVAWYLAWWMLLALSLSFTLYGENMPDYPEEWNWGA